MEDIADHIKPVTRRKPDLLIIHAGTNDLTRGINTIEVLRKTITFVKKKAQKYRLPFPHLLLDMTNQVWTRKCKTSTEKLKYCAWKKK